MHSEEKVLPHSPLFRVHIYHLKESNQNVLVTSTVAADALEIVDTFAACYSAIHVLEEVLCMAYKFTPEDFSREFLKNNETLFLGV
jgi:hypothetical protein